MRTLLAIGLYTGLRLGDAATLRWCEVDLTRRIIIRIPNKTARRNPHPITIPIHATLAAVLQEAPHESKAEYILPETAAAYLRDSSATSKWIHDHFIACGIRPHKPGTGYITEIGKDGKPKRVFSGTRAVVEVGFHSLRHSFVSLCRAANAPLSVVEGIVGHSNPAMTRHYTHTSEAAATAAVACLPAMLGETASSNHP